MSRVLLVLFLSLFAVTAGATEKEWNYITVCTDIKTGKIVVEEKSTSSVGISSSDYFYSYDTKTGDRVFTFSLGADVICKYMNKKTYELRR